MLTDEQHTAYLAEPWRCPHCQHTGLSIIDHENIYSEWNDPIWTAQMEVTMSCNSCSKRWVKVYRHELIGVKDDED